MSSVTRKYTFSYVETDESGCETASIKSFTTDSDSWHGFDGPVHNFFNFLKGLGFLFNVDEGLAVVDGITGDVRNSAPDWEI